jgi:hypothetical protein
MVLQSAAPNLTLRAPSKVTMPMTSKLMPANTIKVTTPKVITAKAPPPSILRTQNRQGMLLQTNNTNVTYVLQGKLIKTSFVGPRSLLIRTENLTATISLF